MITPKFQLSQNENQLIIRIHAPYIKAQLVDLHVEGEEFRFHVAPYFLRLNLPGRVVEDEDSTAKYDIGTGELLIHLTKETPGEEFQDLDLVSKLLARKSELTGTPTTTTRRPLMEVLSSVSHEVPPSDALLGELEGEEEEIDWELPQEYPTMPTNSLLKTPYGFNQQYTGYFDHVQETPNEINELPNPESSSWEERRRIRLELEDEKFDEDYYVGDYLGAFEPEFQALLNFKPTWSKALKEIQKGLYKSSNSTLPPNLTPLATPKHNSTSLITPLDTPSHNLTSLITPLDTSDPPRPSSPQEPSGFLMKEVSTRSIKPLITPIDAPQPTNSPSAEQSLITQLEELTVTSSELQPQPNLSQTVSQLQPDLSQPPSNLPLHPLLEFTDSERDLLLNLPRREFLIDPSESRVIYLGLLDIVLSYSYDHRVTEGDPSPESSWTVGKLCSTMTCLERFTSISEVLIAHRRRTLCYPLYRHFDLADRVVRDTLVLFKLGRRALLKVLLALKSLFDHHDVHYRYSKIFLDDYCVWLQTHAKEEILRSMSQQLHRTTVTRTDLADWDLLGLEQLARTMNPDDA